MNSGHNRLINSLWSQLAPPVELSWRHALKSKVLLYVPSIVTTLHFKFANSLSIGITNGIRDLRYMREMHGIST